MLAPQLHCSKLSHANKGTGAYAAPVVQTDLTCRSFERCIAWMEIACVGLRLPERCASVLICNHGHAMWPCHYDGKGGGLPAYLGSCLLVLNASGPGAQKEKPDRIAQFRTLAVVHYRIECMALFPAEHIVTH